jgi:hypothetical protein
MMFGFAENLLTKIRERQTGYHTRLLSGSFSTLEEYKLIVGKSMGMDECQEILKKLYKDVYEGHKEVTENEQSNE